LQNSSHRFIRIFKDNKNASAQGDVRRDNPQVQNGDKISISGTNPRYIHSGSSPILLLEDIKWSLIESDAVSTKTEKKKITGNGNTRYFDAVIWSFD